MVSSLGALRQCGKVMTFRETRRGRIEFRAVLATSPKLVPENAAWRPNEAGVLVAGTCAVAMQCPSESIAPSLTFPVFGRGGEKIIQERRRFLEANGIATFFTWEDCGGLARRYVASVTDGRLLCGSDGRYGETDLAGVDWTRHGLVYVSPEQTPLSLSLHLSLHL